jgi:carboxyl-terminal processing protease
MNNKNKFSTLLVFFAILGFLSFRTDQPLQERQRLILDILMEGLSSSHYAPVAIDDDFSEKLFDLYIKRLDYNKKFLLESDINQLSGFRKKVDDEIRNGSFEMFRLSNQIIVKRIQEREVVCREILAKPFNYETTDEYETDADKISFCKTEEQLKDEWRKSLHYQTILRLHEMMDEQEKKLEKKDSSFVAKPFDSLEVNARKKVLKANEDWFKRLKKVSEKERFASYVNCITALYDPHTEFFPPKEKKQFDQSMSGQLEGIGAKLQQKDGIIKVTEIVVGSPSYKQGELKAGDAIIKVAQGEKEPVEVTDMELDEAIELIKGKKGTEVRLTVKKPDGSEKIIPIIRDVIQLEETFAQSAILKVGNSKIGYIRLPVFYSDFTRNGARRCGQDMKTETKKLKEAGVDGIIVDLRDNGGGSLSEVIDMVGHYITSGPVVQVVKKRGGRPEVHRDYNSEIVYDGPMAVMVNRNSASASEIFAAAMQDYKRAVIVGTSDATFGKGTVQQFMDMDNYLNNEYDTIKPLGAVKITMQKFYRINGGATQLRGVRPDIVLPDAYSEIESGEKELDFPMQWDEISPADYKEWKATDIAKLKSKSAGRIKKNAAFELVKEQADYFKRKKDDSKYSLNLKKFREEEKALLAESKKFESIRTEIKNFEAALLEEDLNRIAQDTAKVSKEKKWAASLKKDIHLYETVNILEDIGD